MRFVPLATALAAVLAVAAPAAAAVPAQCALVAPPASRTFAVVLAGGARATVVDRYGGAFQRTRRFVQWTVRMSGFSGSAPVSAADFVVDGRVVHTDDTIQSRRPGQATLQWATSSNGFAAGDHQLVIRLHQRTGETREIEIPFTATNCPFASFSAEALREPRPLAVIVWASAPEGPGPDLASVAATLRSGASFGAPRVRPGSVVGVLEVDSQSYTLTAPRSGGVLLRAASLTVTLDEGRRRVAVAGLPDGTTTVTLRLRGGILRAPTCSRAVFSGELRSADGDRVTMDARDARRC